MDGCDKQPPEPVNMAEPTTAIPTGGNTPDIEVLDPADKLPVTNPDAEKSLDDLMKAALAEQEGPTDEEIAAAEKAEKEKAEKADADKAAAEKEKAEKEKATVKETVIPTETPAPTPVEKKDKFDEIELPPYTKPKAAEAFATVKTLARQEVAEALKTVSEMKSKLEALENKAKEGLPAEVKQELEQLREFRAKMDVDADPSFKQWDSQIEQNVQSIYEKLKAAGLGEPELKKIQELGGPGEVDWEAIASKLPPHVKRYIDAKLVENEDLGDRKKRAVETAKQNAIAFVKERQGSIEGQASQRKAQVEKEIADMTPRLEWLQDKAIPADADAATKKSLEANNTFLAKVRESMKDAVEDDSPTMKSILVLGFAQLQKVRADYEAFKATAKAKEEQLTKELTESKAFIERIKKTSTTRLRESAAPGVGDKKTVIPANVHETGAEALDRQLKEALAAKKD